MTLKKFAAKYWGWTFLIVPIILQIIFFYFPMVQGAFYSLTDWNGFTYNFNFVGLNNYRILFMDAKFMKAIGFTLLLTVCLIVGEIAFGILIARALNAKIKGRLFWRAWFFFPAVLSGLTVSLIFKQVFNYGLPAIGNWLHLDFLTDSILGNQVGAIIAVIFVMLWQGIAMPVIIFLAGLQSIPDEIKEAAAMDGANNTQIFWKIELPYLLPSISMVFIMALKAGFTAFDQIFALTSGGPTDATTSIGLLIYNYAFKNNQYGYANAIALVLFVVIALISILQVKLSNKYEVQ
ncbi:MAG: sugar ABC transporter permease [Lactobacillus mulieris]|uniref:Sugar ABC transporter permease n=1 Tax=Lactobacillus mulieris TaxID=2508708 RepID=A0AAP3GX40_9LACO|nr:MULTISPECIES: sugar ABC transporter permease [Lactobacillus]KAA9244691.1 sugar ABC transporter permease [Lactobacillus jensenii]MCF1796966.1 sugar ABC transporter permease [Lactobacillus mulieris]MCT7674173.1 sugar ABC transporter permease [Lactobacillus mulieris]MCT7772258.1 sugar ABC transporter permease [Lactobacillus mulieris]MCW8094272.1 sugar ABC transporter permease [Lactobacillus mulieris]